MIPKMPVKMAARAVLFGMVSSHPRTARALLPAVGVETRTPGDQPRESERITASAATTRMSNARIVRIGSSRTPRRATASEELDDADYELSGEGHVLGQFILILSWLDGSLTITETFQFYNRARPRRQP